MSVYEITQELCTLNEYTDAERKNRYAAAKIKKDNTKICTVAAMAVKPFTYSEKLYDVEIEWYVTNNRKDPDNIYFGVKFILDGLVKAGVLKNDGRQNIRHISHKIFTADKYCVLVELKEVK